MSLFYLDILFILNIITCRSIDTPVIGVLTIPCLPEDVEVLDCPYWTELNTTSYIATSYVKWLEAGGARVVPILITDSLESVSKLVLQLNGVFLTGGIELLHSTSIYYNQVFNILETLRKYHGENPLKSIPLWGTCLGFQAMIVATSKTGPSIMSTGYDHHEADNVHLIPYLDLMNQKIFGHTMPRLYQTVVKETLNESVAWFSHDYGFTPYNFLNDEYVNGNFSIIGTSIVDQNQSNIIVSLIESKGEHDVSLSWYASQFHPEKPEYEFTKNGKNSVHNLDSIIVGQYFSEFFVNECRMRNDIIMNETVLNDIIIYNENPYFMDKSGTAYFEQSYIFIQ